MAETITDVKQNLIPNEPELKDVLELLKKDISLSLNCHAIATIQSFDSEKQTASATVNYRQTYFERGADGVYVPVLKNYPLLVDCPVVCLGGGAGALTFPIAEGDECLVLFNDRDLDNWFSGSSSSAVATSRLHSFADGVLVVGLRSLANSLSDYNTSGTELKFGTTKLKIGATKLTATVENGTTLEINAAGKITITNASGEFIATLLDALTTAITNTILGPQPLVFNPALLTILQSFKAP